MFEKRARIKCAYNQFDENFATRPLTVKPHSIVVSHFFFNYPRFTMYGDSGGGNNRSEPKKKYGAGKNRLQWCSIHISISIHHLLSRENVLYVLCTHTTRRNKREEYNKETYIRDANINK